MKKSLKKISLAIRHLAIQWSFNDIKHQQKILVYLEGMFSSRIFGSTTGFLARAFCSLKIVRSCPVIPAGYHRTKMKKSLKKNLPCFLRLDKKPEEEEEEERGIVELRTRSRTRPLLTHYATKDKWIGQTRWSCLS